jgi:hypothetical protein
VPRLLAAHRVLGPPTSRWGPLWSPPGPPQHEAWLVDTAHTSVAALWLDGTLWLSGDRVHAIANGLREPLSPSAEAPPGATSLRAGPWTRLAPVVGTRYVASAGAARDPDPALADPDALLDRMLELPSRPAPGMLARLLGKRSPEAAALVLDIVDEPAPLGLLAWLADLRARDVDLGWIGNESGPGLVHTIQQPLRQELDVRTALLAHAREHADLVALVREHAEAWLEVGDGVPVEEGRLVPHDPACGWIEDLELEAITDGIEGDAGAWLDPGTPHARPAWSLFLPGSAILATLRRTVDHPTIVAVCSAPTEPVLTIHLVGGIDRSSGELVGFVLQRVWT